MITPFILPPHPLAQSAAGEVINKVHAYMRVHPDSELHRQGKMFGVLVCTDGTSLAAFSAKLDGSYHHPGFVPPVFEMVEPPVGASRAESQRLQRLLFANYRFSNLRGETRDLLEIFADEKPILSPDEWFDPSARTRRSASALPPSGAGECCAPKLLQYALTHGKEPFALAEFWVGAPSRTEIRQEGAFYAPCSGRCRPILRWMIEEEGLPVTGHGLPGKVEVLYEDAWLMVVDKPAGLLSVPGRTGETSVEDCCGAKAVHRLDQDTSGLLVLAKTAEVYKTLQTYFQRRDILKRYEAILLPDGTHTIPSEGLIDLPLLPNPYDRPRQMVDHAHGKPAVTRFAVRERRPDGTLFVDFFPLTGRTHQLRVHAAHPDGLRAPLLGDRLYGAATPQLASYADRLHLHAAEIRFLHPLTQEEMHFCIPSCF